MTTLPTGPFPADVWARMLNIPIDQVRVGAQVTPFGMGGRTLEFVWQKD